MKKSKLGLLVSISLMASSVTPLRSVAEQVSDEQIGNQLEIENPTIPDKGEILVDEEIEEGDESFSDKEDNLDEAVEKTEELSEDESKIVNNEIESTVVDKTIIDQGRLEFGDWILYSDGQLYLEGVVTKEASQAWAQYALSIKSIVFSQSDLRGDFSKFFIKYENVETIDFGVATLTSVTSMTSAFEGLKNLKKVLFKDVRHSTSLLTNTQQMFFGCRALTELDLSGLNTSEVTTMERMFVNCSSLTELDLSGFSTSEVTSMAFMFSSCSVLTELDVSGFSTSKVTSMASMFSSCSVLTELDVSGFDTSKVTDMRSMFYTCSALTELDVSGFDTSKVTDMRSMFYICSALTELDVSGFDTSKVTDMSNMFRECRVLTELDVSGFDTSKVTDMYLMFYYCRVLTELDVSGFDTSKVTLMYNMFFNCRGLTELDVSGFDTSKVTNMSGMFSNCIALTELDVSGFDTSEVTSMSSMFTACSALTKLDVSGFDTSEVTNMSSMFNTCSALTKLDVSGFDTSKVTSMTMMFNDCIALTELDVSGFDTSKVTSMSMMFYNCIVLTEISISKDFKFGASTNFPTLSGKYAWQEENNRQLFFSTSDMIAYHNDSNETNTYRKVAYVELTMNAKGGKFDDGTEKNIQIKVMDELWEEQIPTKENYQFDGWYLDEAYTKKFDFSQPAAESLSIFAKWVENYTVTIPATINLNPEDKLTISGINNGSGTLKVNLKGAESQISDFTRLRLTQKQNADITVHTILKWEQQSSDIWNVLTIEPEASSVSKSADIGLTKPENAQAGDYEGQMVFSISYE